MGFASSQRIRFDEARLSRFAGASFAAVVCGESQTRCRLSTAAGLARPARQLQQSILISAVGGFPSSPVKMSLYISRMIVSFRILLRVLNNR